jgi:hypothetical protein
VQDHGTIIFEQNSTDDSQNGLARSLAYAFGRLCRIMNMPPSPAELLVMREVSFAPLESLACVIDQLWDGENDLEDAITVTVNVDTLGSSRDEAEIQQAMRTLRGHPITLVRDKRD